MLLNKTLVLTALLAGTVAVATSAQAANSASSSVSITNITFTKTGAIDFVPLSSAGVFFLATLTNDQISFDNTIFTNNDYTSSQSYHLDSLNGHAFSEAFTTVNLATGTGASGATTDGGYVGSTSGSFAFTLGAGASFTLTYDYSLTAAASGDAYASAGYSIGVKRYSTPTSFGFDVVGENETISETDGLLAESKVITYKNNTSKQIYAQISYFTGAAGFAAPVPEPESYAMMLAGLLTLGFAARRRKV